MVPKHTTISAAITEHNALDITHQSVPENQSNNEPNEEKEEDRDKDAEVKGSVLFPVDPSLEMNVSSESSPESDDDEDEDEDEDDNIFSGNEEGRVGIYCTRRKPLGELLECCVILRRWSEAAPFSLRGEVTYGKKPLKAESIAKRAEKMNSR